MGNSLVLNEIAINVLFRSDFLFTSICDKKLFF